MQLFTKGRHLCMHALATFPMPKIASAILVVSFMLSASVAWAATGAPTILNYQGRLMDGSGNLLGGSGTPYCFKYSLYDNPAVGSGSKLWPASTPSTMTVTVKNGIFNVGIGDTGAGGDTLNYNFQDSDSVYLNVDVATRVGATCAPGDGAEVFETLSPRQRIYSSGYALNANTVGGFLAVQSATGNQIPVLSSGNLILGGTNPILSASTTNTLTLQGSATGDLQFFSSANKITSAGNLTLSGFITGAGATYANSTTTNATTTNSFSQNATIANLTVGNATTTAGNGINVTNGCFSVNGTCLITTNNLLSTAHAWSQLQIFQAGTISQASSTFIGQFNAGQASSTQLTVSGSTNLAGVTVTGVASTTALVVSGASTLSDATTTALAVTSITSGLVSTNATGGLQKALLNGTLTYSSNTIALNLASVNVWTGLQQFGNASTSLLESTLQYAQTIQSTSTTQALVLQSNFSSTAGLTIGSTSTPQVIAIDTINNKVRFGTGTGQPNPVVGVFDTGNATDPTGVNGAEYYSSNFNDFRCFGNGAWRNCGGQAASSTGDVQFKNSDGSFTATGNFFWSIGNNGLTTKGNAGQPGALFTVASSTGTSMFDISSAGIIETATTSEPSTPLSGVDLYTKSIAGRGFLAVKDSSGSNTSLQPFFARNKIGYWNPQGNSNLVPGIFGFTAPTVVSAGGTTYTARIVATTNLATRMRRLGLVTTAIAGTLASQYVAVAQYTVGDGAGNGGFNLIARFVPSDAATTSGERFFMGMSSAIGVPTNVEPSTLTNSIGIAQLSTGTDCEIVYGGSVAQTPIDLGPNFNCGLAGSKQAFEIALYAPPD